ncbi:MAG: hypothetical protein EBT06_12265 [Gammaproteobacteria bacterium]|nr:hypothetical protein [Gammaproteobacteria bacterium]NBT45661.1 hypothetical protein [Gammaproteobacteria bacterium]NDE35714.1 hypothetical protein [Gammaproteobacteria bacterium]NDE57549.1 hypothetical protein [Gammaproteobacteria bacterium]NDG88819.1 hypothetical protein [Gammaproteobacteria bacterium]
MNVAQGQCPDEATQQIFLNLVDNFTELHLRILKTFQAPTPPPNVNMTSLGAVLVYNLPELAGNQALCTHIWQDPYRNGLVNTDRIDASMTGTGLSAERTTSFGDQFLQFISS